MKFNELLRIEEKIEASFLNLANLEINGCKESKEYEDLVQVLTDLVEQEKEIIANFTMEEKIILRKQVLKHCKPKNVSLALGYLTNASYLRLLHLLNALMGSDYYFYASYLRYDINQIIFPILAFLIENPYYEAIRKDLILYKYNCIFMNYLSEADFLNQKDPSFIQIESKSFKTEDNFDFIFVDKSMLVLEGKEYTQYLEQLEDDFKENNNEYTLAVISIIELLARLILSDSEVLPFLQPEFDGLLESDENAFELKNLIQELLLILEQLKDQIDIAR